MRDFDSIIDFAREPKMTGGDNASGRRLPPLAQEAEKFDSLAQPTPQHLRTSNHFVRDGGNLWCTEIKALVEIVHRLKNFGVAEMWVTQGGDLRAALRQ